jgi:hypothetical protein
MSLLTVSYVFSVAFLFQLFLVSHFDCHNHRTMCLTALQFAVSCLLLKLNRPSLSRPPHSGMFTLLMAFVVVIVTWAGNIALAYVECPLPASRLAYPLCMHRPTSLGVFSASFAVVFIALFATSAQPTILRLALQLYSISPFVRWRLTRGWQDRLVSWYKTRRAARVCVWLKNDDVRLSFEYLIPLCYSTLI